MNEIVPKTGQCGCPPLRGGHASMDSENAVRPHPVPCPRNIERQEFVSAATDVAGYVEDDSSFVVEICNKRFKRAVVDSISDLHRFILQTLDAQCVSTASRGHIRRRNLQLIWRRSKFH